MLSARCARCLARHGVHYGWVMVALTFLTMLATAAAMSMPGVLLVPLRNEFTWNATQISGALALRLLLFGLTGPFAAALMLRYGLKATVCAALGLIVCGLAGATAMRHVWQLWLYWGVMVGLGTGMTAIVLGATVANRWFVAQRGLVLGLLTASAATGQLVFLPAAAWLAQTHGWRLAVLPPILACMAAAVALVLFGADDPIEVGQRPYGARDGQPPDDVSARDTRLGRPSAGAVRTAFATLAEASGQRLFWMLFATFAVCGFTTTGLVQSHFIATCLDSGMTEVAAAGVLALMGLFDFVGTIGSGWLSDRFDNRWLLFWYFALRGVALLILPLSSFTLAGLSVFAVFYGLDWIATVPPTVKLASGVCGRERAPLVFGWIFTGHQLGAALAVVGAGLSRDVLNSYLPAYLVGGALCVAAASAAVLVRPAQSRVATRIRA